MRFTELKYVRVRLVEAVLIDFLSSRTPAGSQPVRRVAKDAVADERECGGPQGGCGVHGWNWDPVNFKYARGVWPRSCEGFVDYSC